MSAAATDKRIPQTQGGRLLKRGDAFDPECWRTTHRLRVAKSILHGQGIVAEWPEHTDECGRHPRNLFNVVHSYRNGVICTCGRDQRGPNWPKWVTGAMFDTAYRLAAEIQTERGAYNRREAYNAKQARRAEEARR